MFRIVTRRRKHNEAGFILIAVIFAVTLAIIALAVGVPAIKTQIKRDREAELMHRGNQYARAIQLYYRKFGRYPNSVDELLDTNNLRFLRKKYTDPITGKDEWRMIHFGQATVKPVPAYLRGNNGGRTAGGPAANPTGGQPAAGIAGAVSTAQGVGADATNASDISQRIPGSAIGGGPIVGVASTSDKEGLKEKDGKTKYSEWEFVYDPALDPNARAGANQNGQPANNTNPGPRPTPGSRGR